MTVTLLTDRIWPTLTAAAKSSRIRPAVAVAYFGQGAAKLLPLPNGSRLVVDASESAVKSGQTCPAELKKLLKRGVRIYTRNNLHAKIFVFGTKVFVGSANVSQNSAHALREAMVVTTDSKAVAAAKEFVHGLCIQELGPEMLSRLGKLYRPPRLPGALRRRGSYQKRDGADDLPRLRLAQLHLDPPPVESESAREAGRKLAAKRMERPRRHELDEFWCGGNYSASPGDIVVQVLDEGGNQHMVSPPGTVLHTRKWRRGKRELTFVFVELPARRRIALDRLARRLGRGSKKRLYREGQASRAFAERLLQAWQN
jgi:hypothetical protein